MSKAASKRDSQGRLKVECRICGLYFHNVANHLSKTHPDTSLAEYKKMHPEAPIYSEAARKRMQEEIDAEEGIEIEADADEEVGEAPLIFGKIKLATRPSSTLTDVDKAWVPVHDEGWHLGKTEERNLEALALAIQQDENALIVGPPGVGKSTLVRQLAVLMNQPVRRLPFNGEMRLSHLVGRDKLVTDKVTGQTVSKTMKGPLLDAAERGHWVVFEEFDSAPAHVTFVLHSMLEKPRQLTLSEESGKQVHFDERFRVVATANTLGYGDTTGLYAGTAPMNEALLDRFGVVLRVDYPSAEDEAKILIGRTKIDAKTADKMTAIAKHVREQQQTEKVLVSLSPRRLVMWAAATVRLGSPQRAAELCITNKIPKEDAEVISGLVQRYFGSMSTV